jgi:CheY-like chemotaxis protein
MPLPENGRFGIRKEMGRGNRIRAYYLSTTLPKSQLENVQAVVDSLMLEPPVQVVPRQNILVIMGQNGAHFPGIAEVEKVQTILYDSASDLFYNLTVAYDEVNARASSFGLSTVESSSDDVTLDELIASQRDTSLTAGRQIVLAVKEEEEREAFNSLFVSMELVVQQAETGGKALELLEDHPADLLLMDLTLPDMHGWQMINKIKEIETLRDLPVMVITDEVNIGMRVARVDYLTRPVSIARLRHNVWKILTERVYHPRSSS